jgi:hypothetical protein
MRFTCLSNSETYDPSAVEVKIGPHFNFPIPEEPWSVLFVANGEPWEMTQEPYSLLVILGSQLP